MTFYITKYCLSEGIWEVDCQEPKDGMIHYIPSSCFAYAHGEGREWHRTKESAIAVAEQIRAKKISSLKKQLARLEKLTFEIKPCPER